MNADLRIIARLPLKELWRDDGVMNSSRIRPLTEEDIANLLRAGPVQFVVAEVGSPLYWLPLGKCYEFWRTELKPHLAAPESPASLSDFPENYCYFASEWSSDNKATSTVACEKHH